MRNPVEAVLYNIRMDMDIPLRPLFFTQLIAWEKA